MKLTTEREEEEDKDDEKYGEKTRRRCNSQTEEIGENNDARIRDFVASRRTGASLEAASSQGHLCRHGRRSCSGAGGPAVRHDEGPDPVFADAGDVADRGNPVVAQERGSAGVLQGHAVAVGRDRGVCVDSVQCERVDEAVLHVRERRAEPDELAAVPDCRRGGRLCQRVLGESDRTRPDQAPGADGEQCRRCWRVQGSHRRAEAHLLGRRHGGDIPGPCSDAHAGVDRYRRLLHDVRGPRAEHDAQAQHCPAAGRVLEVVSLWRPRRILHVDHGVPCRRHQKQAADRHARRLEVQKQSPRRQKHPGFSAGLEGLLCRLHPDDPQSCAGQRSHLHGFRVDHASHQLITLLPTLLFHLHRPPPP